MSVNRFQLADVKYVPLPLMYIAGLEKRNCAQLVPVEALPTLGVKYAP